MMVFPAHAGVFLSSCQDNQHHEGIPRSRGGVSCPACTPPASSAYSPLTRGCFWKSTIHGFITLVFPAHAGVFPIKASRMQTTRCIPRSRGGVSFKLHEWTWDDRYSPLTRGCFLPADDMIALFSVFPAHAGVFPI